MKLEEAQSSIYILDGIIDVGVDYTDTAFKRG